jgi:hypothetical protein
MYCTSFSKKKKKILTLLQEQDADANFPFYFTEAESQEEGQAWWLGVKGLDYEESRYYNFRIVLEVNSLCRAQDNFYVFQPSFRRLLCAIFH